MPRYQKGLAGLDGDADEAMVEMIRGRKSLEVVLADAFQESRTPGSGVKIVEITKI